MLNQLFRVSRALFIVLVTTFGIMSSPVTADTPAGVEDMLKTALAADDRAKFDTIMDMALATWPASRMDILRTVQSLRNDWLSDGERQEIADAIAAEVEAERKSRARGIWYFLDPKLWNAQAQAGAAASTGDTDEQAVSLGLSFNRDFGEKWSHDLNLDFDYARSEGETTRRRVLTRYEALFRPNKVLNLINYFEADFNKFSGFEYRILDNIAVGAHLVKNKRQSLRLEGGPGIRLNKFEDTGLTDTEFLGRLASTYNLKLTDNITFQDRASIIFGGTSTTFDNRAMLGAQINSSLAARLTVQVQYDSGAPIGASAWDSITRATLVYDF